MARRGVIVGRRLLFPSAISLLFSVAVFSENEAPGARLRFRFTGDYSAPVLGDESLFDPGYAVAATAEYSLSSYLSPLARVATTSLSLKSLEPISVLEGALGVSSRFDFRERLFARAELSGGLFNAAWGDYRSSGLVANARAELGFRLTPAFRLSAGVGFSRFFQASDALYTGFAAGLSLSLFPEGLDRTASRLAVENVKLSAVFPVFYSFYDDNPFGSARIRNGEDLLIRDVRVSFFAPEYMSGPTECAVFDALEKGQSVEVPVTALFDEKIMSLTERTRTRGQIIVQYRMLGSRREFRADVELGVHHRNSMTWTDDRRAAAFVSAKDPAVLWFSRFVNAVVRDRFRPGIDRNLQQAVGIFEAMKLFGLAYVVDPSSSYVDLSGKEDVVDYLQYPHQTLFYRGGDCDDLSILYASLLQSVGIETAFITVPGHIYMAFATELTEAQARRDFYDPDLLIFRGGKVWVPVEITMVKDGFVKAWRVGAKQWSDNVRAGSAEFFRMADNWKEYPAVGVSDVNPRFQLPDEALTMRAFDMALDRHVAREIEPRIRDLKARIALAPSAEAENEIGLVYARYGMLTEAWNYFSNAAQRGFMPAWTNLANIAFIRKDFSLALDYYRYALEYSDFESAAALGVARCEYELELFSDAAKSYGILRDLDPSMAGRYGYLVSMFGGTGRAWSLSERAETVEWVQTARVRPPAPMPAPREVPAHIAALPEAAPPATQPRQPAAAPSAAAAAATVADPAAPPMAAAPAPVALPARPSEPEAEASDAPPAAVLSAAEAATGTVAPDVAAEPAPELPSAPGTVEELASVPATELVSVPETAHELIAAPGERAAVPESAPLESAEAARLAGAVEPAPSAVPAAAIAASAPESRPSRVAPRIAAAPVDADLSEKEAESVRAVKEEAEPLEPAPVASAPQVALAPPAQRQAARPAPVIAAAPADADLKEKEAEAARMVPQETMAPSAAPTAVVAQEPAVEPAVPAAPAAAAVVVQEAAPEPARVAVAAAPEAPEASESEAPPAAEPAAPAAARPAPVIAAAPAAAAPHPSEPAAPVAPEPAVSAAPAAVVAQEAAPGPARVAVAAAPEAPKAEAPLAAEPAAPESFVAIETIAAASTPSFPEGPIPASDTLAKKTELSTVVSPAPLIRGFSSFSAGLGKWLIDSEKAAQLDPRQMFAKIALTLPESTDKLRVSFDARSTGSGWVGFGVHVHVSGQRTLEGYGAGSSYLVWFTADPRRYPDAPDRLQLYRSYGDVDMRMIHDQAVGIPLDRRRSYVIESDIAERYIRVSIDGVEHLVFPTGKWSLPAGPTLILRSLDTVELYDFRADAMMNK